MKKIDMTGWIMSEHGVPDSRLTVIKEVEPHISSSGNKSIQYLCECSCSSDNGKHLTIIVRGANLRNGNTKSCGCIAKEKIIERNISQGRTINIGDTFGKLTVIKDLGMRKQKSRNKNWRWSLCQCECGSKPIEVANNILLNGHKKSCGCIQSVGEEIIEKILKENNIQYIKEYSFSDLTNSLTGYHYRYDFAIFKDNTLNFLIEFDGRQHYTGPEAGWTDRSSLEEIIKKDKIKNDYCIKNNIILKRIPYFLISKITVDTILDDTFNISEEKFRIER